MVEYAQEIRRARQHGQDHIFRFWKELDVAQQKKLLLQAASIDYELIEKQYQQEDKPVQEGHIEPPVLLSKEDQGKKRDAALDLGEKAIENGELALFTVAGGQASRLGFDGPKGCFKATPVKRKPIFQILAERILAFEKKHHCNFQWYIMTSKANDAYTKAFFYNNEYFGLSADQIFFFSQDMIPAIDRNGKLLLKEKDEIFMNPNGTGGIYDALVTSGSLNRMKRNGIKYLSYFQIDNPLIDFIDPLFLGYHIQERAEMSTKVVEKQYPEEKVGLVVNKDGKTSMIEYFMLPEKMAQEKEVDGKLKYRAANIAMHIINLDFIENISEQDLLSYHKSAKSIPHLDEDGKRVIPESKNGFKFERLVFDVLDQAKHSVTYSVKREEEFAPIKNASGKDSPKSAIRIQNELYRSWLENASITVPEMLVDIEISPLYALDRKEFTLKSQGLQSDISRMLEGKRSFYFGKNFSLKK
ncbi:MAG: UTP--glucose-1-phosphate uridylyltransferase [Nanoarchaeota archaeon]